MTEVGVVCWIFRMVRRRCYSYPGRKHFRSHPGPSLFESHPGVWFHCLISLSGRAKKNCLVNLLLGWYGRLNPRLWWTGQVITCKAVPLGMKSNPLRLWWFVQVRTGLTIPFGMMALPKAMMVWTSKNLYCYTPWDEGLTQGYDGLGTAFYLLLFLYFLSLVLTKKLF